jgi:hypothetical protein
MRASDMSPLEKTMEIQQLKLLAGRVRALLEQSNHPVGHSQSLDLVAALPGLRNWPEVVAFPERVNAFALDGAAASRLAFRLKKKFDVDLQPDEVWTALSMSPSAANDAPQIWPTGPTPGVYVTTSQEAINALLERYEEATDGALVYAERAGNHWEGAIDLGEGGLWSSGLHRVPSGTLLVVGPLELNQESWDDSARRLEMACLRVQVTGHRVAVLIETLTPDAMCEDCRVLVRSIQKEGDDCDTALTGIISGSGEMERREPFARPRQAPKRIKSVATVDSIPLVVRPALQEAIAKRPFGLLLFGSEVIQTHHAIDFVAASLTLTEHAGPAARIMPRSRSTPAKDWLVPEAIKQLPFLPSIESAYDQGFRRMIFTPGYSNSEVLIKFPDVLFIGGTYGFDVSSVFMSALRGGSLCGEEDLLKAVIAILGVIPLPTKRDVAVASDLFVMPAVGAKQPKKFDDILKFLEANRAVRWQDELGRLLDTGTVTAAAIRKAAPRSEAVKDLLAQRKKGVPSGTRH